MSDRPLTSFAATEGARIASPVPRQVAAIAFGVVAVTGLVVGALHGARQQSSLATSASARSWQLDMQYWSCLDAQARSLAPPGSRVWLDYHNLGEEILLQKVFVPWTTEVTRRDQAKIWISLRSDHGGDSCLGTALKGTYPESGHATPVVRDGTGGNLPGRVRQLPTTPL